MVTVRNLAFVVRLLLGGYSFRPNPYWELRQIDHLFVKDKKRKIIVELYHCVDSDTRDIKF